MFLPNLEGMDSPCQGIGSLISNCSSRVSALWVACKRPVLVLLEAMILASSVSRASLEIVFADVLSTFPWKI